MQYTNESVTQHNSISITATYFFFFYIDLLNSPFWSPLTNLSLFCFIVEQLLAMILIIEAWDCLILLMKENNIEGLSWDMDTKTRIWSNMTENKL
jgi:hypothetical protein